jgi:hypothetical protein
MFAIRFFLFFLFLLPSCIGANDRQADGGRSIFPCRVFSTVSFVHCLSLLIRDIFLFFFLFSLSPNPGVTFLFFGRFRDRKAYVT